MKNFVFYLRNLLLLILVKHSISIQFVPFTRKIEVNQNDRYVFGIEDDGEIEIERCIVTSDTGIKHSFLVRPVYSNQQGFFDDDQSILETKGNTITDRGVEGLCQIVVSNVQDDGPKLWNLVAKDYDNELVVNTTFTIVEFFYSASILVPHIRVSESASFLNYITALSANDKDISLVSCYAKMNNTIKVELDLETSNVKILSSPYTETIEDLSKRISSLGFLGHCGFKFTNATFQLRNMPWSISAIDDTGISYRAQFHTNIIPKLEVSHWVKKVTLGDECIISCMNITHKACTIFYSQNKVVETSKCSYNIESVTMEDIGMWKCYAMVNGNMQSQEYKIQVVAIGSPNSTGRVHETNQYVNIGCQSITTPLHYCKMVTPNQEILNIQPGLATDRYFTAGTNLTAGWCSLTMLKPIQQSEEGQWRCELKNNYLTVYGAILTIGDVKPYPRYQKLTARLNKPFTIKCEVPYSTDYCYIQTPTFDELLPDDFNKLSLGECSYRVQKGTVFDRGNWTCHFARKTGLSDEKIIIDVEFSEFLSTYREVTAELGDTIDLMCSSHGAPLHYCRYLSPEQIYYHIRDDDSDYDNSERIIYNGRGIRYGECGIRIRGVTSKDRGTWTCYTQLLPNNNEENIGITKVIIEDL